MKRLPIIRHIRWMIWDYRVQCHYAMWREMGSLPVNYRSDKDHLDAIWRGEE